MRIIFNTFSLGWKDLSGEKKKEKTYTEKSQRDSVIFLAGPVILLLFPELFLWPEPPNVKLLFVHPDF